MALDASPVQADPIRAVAYIRVSQARDGMISPELQLRAIEDYCRRRGYLLQETLQDLDLSGRFWQQRQMEQAISMVETDAADVIVVWRWSRVSRNRLDWAMAVDRVEAAGGQLESATEAFDTTTSTGRLARGILAEMAAFESERIGDVWREVAARRAGLGLPNTAPEMFGYRKRNGGYVADRRTGPTLADLYRRFNAGTSFAELARWLNSHHVRGKVAHQTWNTRLLAAMMDRGFAAGYIRYHGNFLPGAHKPLISETEWHAYLARRAATRWGKHGAPDDFLLVGMFFCACGGRMSTVQGRSRNGLRYQCLDHTVGVPGKSMTRALAERLVYSWLCALVTDPSVSQAAEADARRFAEEQSQIAAELRQQMAAGGDTTERATTVEALAAARAASVTPSPVDMARALLEDWIALTPLERRPRLAGLVRRVDVTNQHPTSGLQIRTVWGADMLSTGATAEPQGFWTDPEVKAVATTPASAERIDPRGLLTPAEAARIAGVKVHTVRSWDVAGLMPHTQWSPGGVGRRYAIQDLRLMRARYKTHGVWVALDGPSNSSGRSQDASSPSDPTGR